MKHPLNLGIRWWAALASARMGCSTLLLTINLDTIALMSCNPAIGGLAKGQLVKEIDALGGEMAKNIDATGIQFRRINTKKGPAVISSRAQADRQSYRLRMKYVLENQDNLELRQASVERLLVESDTIKGVETNFKERFYAKTVIIAAGTFLNGLIHIGLNHFPAGRMGDVASIGLAENLKDLGFDIGRLKTGTTPRLNGKTIDFSKAEIQKGDDPPHPFSFSTEELRQKQVFCYVTYTNAKAHKIITSGITFRARGITPEEKVVALFPGQGSQYLNMVSELAINFPPVMEAFELMDSLFLEQKQTPLSRVVFPHPVFSDQDREKQQLALRETDYAQAGIGVVSYGIYKILKQAGFEPDMTAGHSFGELTALWAGGSLSDLWRNAGSQIQQGLGSLARQMVGQIQHTVLINCAHIVQPLCRHPVA